jgi:hypothetical protein
MSRFQAAVTMRTTDQATGISTRPSMNPFRGVARVSGQALYLAGPGQK